MDIDTMNINTFFKKGLRRRVLEVLELEREKGLSFKELKESTGSKPTVLAYHLKVLMGMSMIERGVVDRVGRKDYSSYRLTRRGSALMEEMRALMEMGTEGTRERSMEKGPELPLVKVTYMAVGPRCIFFPSIRS